MDQCEQCLAGSAVPQPSPGPDRLPELPATTERETGTLTHALWTGNQPGRAPAPDELEQVEAFREQETTLSREFFSSGEKPIRIVERRLWHEFPTLNGEPGRGMLKTSGQFDVALVQPGSRRALICDGKSGWLPVTPNESNLQLRRLAALLWLQLDCVEIGVCILKPGSEPDPPCTYRVADLQRSVAEMEEDVRRSHAPDPPRVPGEAQCRYCRARELCSARLAWLAAALPSTWPALPMSSARTWTPSQRALFLEREKQARDWLEARREEIKSLLAEAPGAVPGYGLKPGKSVETIKDSREVLKRFCGSFGGTLDAFVKCIKVGKTALKDELRALSGHGGKDLESDLETLLAGCVDIKTSSPTIEKLNGRS